MYKHNRIFCHTSIDTGSTAWYFEAREGVIGPFVSEDHAKLEMNTFIQKQIAAKAWGGRQAVARAKLRETFAASPCRVYKLKD